LIKKVNAETLPCSGKIANFFPFHESAEASARYIYCMGTFIKKDVLKLKFPTLQFQDISGVFFQAGNFLFPQACALCGESLADAGEIRTGLCENCRPSLAPVPEKTCGLCGKPLISERDFCLPCRNGLERSYDRLWTLFPYTGKYRRLLAQYKFEKRTALADFFAEHILRVIGENPVLENARIVPVPPRPGKIKTNGWDQVDYLVKRLEKKLMELPAGGLPVGRLPLCRCLGRKKSDAQKRLNRERRMENLKDRIYSKGTIPQTALLIDDVITTGSTMEVCSSVLKENGAQKVYGLCLFYD
jgi:ComF family protein